MRRFRSIGFAMMGLGLLAALPAQGKADLIQTYDLAWSGANEGNSASATGTITLDLSLISNPGDNDSSVVPFVTAFSITVTGSVAGNGTFGLSDFDSFNLNTGSVPLDFSQQLVGQPTSSGYPWGSVGAGLANGADFNAFSNGNDASAPNGDFYFQLITNGGTGDAIDLVSFAPASVPEPSTFVLAGTAALAGLGAWRRRRLG